MCVISYCQIYSFHPALNLDKIVIYRSFQQTPEEIFDLDNFKSEHLPFLDNVTLKQLKDAATNVLSKQKCTSLAEPFSIELKFTIDTPKAWFNRIRKPIFFEFNCFKKTDWRKKNLVTTETICSICDFPPDAEPENGWFDHVVKAEHPFLKNIYSESEMKSMDILDIENYKEIFYLLLDIYHHFEVALQDGFINDEIREFMAENLCDTYETFQELRQNIKKIVVPKKPFSHKNNNFSDKIIAFLYSHFINFCRTSKAKAIPISKTFFTNMTNILRNTHCVHHSHITEDIIGYAHTFCNEKVIKINIEYQL